MNKNFFALFLLTAVSACSGLMAEQQIVVVDLGKISMETQEFSTLRTKLEAEIKEKAQAIEALEKKFQAAVTNLQTKAKDMTNAALEKAQEEAGRMQAELQVKKQNLQAYVQRVAGEVETKLVTKVREICKAKGWTVVVPNALYADASVDKTNEVIAAMDAKVAKAPAAPKKA